MKNILKKSTPVLIASIIALAGTVFIGSCTVGLGDAVDVDAPTVEISYPSKMQQFVNLLLQPENVMMILNLLMLK